MRSFEYGSCLYPTEEARDRAVILDYLLAGGLNSPSTLPRTPEARQTSVDWYRRDVAEHQWDDSENLCGYSDEDFADLIREAVEEIDEATAR